MRALIIGASRGLGAFLTERLGESGDELVALSRTPLDFGRIQDGVSRNWSPIDLADPVGAATAVRPFTSQPIDLLLYVAGTWLDADFQGSSPEDIVKVVSVNLISFLTITHAAADSLRAAHRGLIVAIGSVSGLANAAFADAAYCSSKAGLRGAVHSLREWLRDSRVGACCLHLGSLERAGGANEEFVAYADVASTVSYLRSLSVGSIPKEITLAAKRDRAC